MLLQPFILPSKVPLMERTPCQNNVISPSPTKYSNKDKKKKKKSDFPLINKKISGSTTQKHTCSKCKFLPLNWDFSVSLICSPVLWSKGPCKGQSPPCWEPASKQVSTTESHIKVLGGGLRWWGQSGPHVCILPF